MQGHYTWSFGLCAARGWCLHTWACTYLQTCAYVYTCKHAHVHTHKYVTICFQYTVLLFCSLVFFLNIATVRVFSCVSKYPFTTQFLIALWYPIVELSLAPSMEVTPGFLAQPSHSGAHPRLPKSSNRSAIIRLNLCVCTFYIQQHGSSSSPAKCCCEAKQSRWRQDAQLSPRNQKCRFQCGTSQSVNVSM